ncbi:MAG: hypothetical protein ACOCWD_03390, partial [Tangfeifania sp.]
DYDRMKRIIRKGSGKRFFDSAKQEWSPFRDFDLCLQKDIFDFVLKVENDGVNNYLQKVNIIKNANVFTG